MNETIYVVGDKFKNVANGKNTIIFTDIIDLILTDEIACDVLSIEQGISEWQVGYIKSLLSYSSEQAHIKVVSYFDKNKRCSEALTHKHYRKNILISDPLETEQEEAYESLLMVDENCAELSDHVTGKHLQFMVLVEAARQMVNAITEKFYANTSMIYLANDLDVKFSSFVYPFATQMRYRVISKKMKAAGNGKMTAVIEFIQNGEVKSAIEFAFTILERNFVTQLEDSALKQVVNG